LNRKARDDCKQEQKDVSRHNFDSALKTKQKQSEPTYYFLNPPRSPPNSKASSVQSMNGR